MGETKDKPGASATPAATNQPNKEQIAQWKTQFGKVFKIEVTLNDDPNTLKIGYYKKPDRKILSAAMRFGNNDPMKFNETLATNCWLAGDEELKTNDDYFIAASTKFGELIQVGEASIKEL